MSEFAAYKAKRDALQAEMDAAAARLQDFPRAANGLTPDAIKFSPEYRAAKLAYEQPFARLRALNGVYATHFKREIAADRDAARLARLAGRG